MPDNDFVDIVTMLRAADRLEPYLCAAAANEIERLREENRQLRELKMRGVVSEPVKATPPHYDNLQDLG